MVEEVSERVEGVSMWTLEYIHLKATHSDHSSSRLESINPGRLWRIPATITQN
jgi:hypothetical protein